MAVTAKWYGAALTGLMNKTIDLDSDNIRIALVTSSYSPNQDTDDFWNDVVANEITGTGYTANGNALSGLSITYDATSNEARFNASNTSWTTSTLTARYAVVYDRTPATDATRPLLIYIDFGADASSTAGTFAVNFSGGIVGKITAA